VKVLAQVEAIPWRFQFGPETPEVMLRLAIRHVTALCLSLWPLCAQAGESPEEVLARHGLKQVNGLWHIAGAGRISERVQMAERLERRACDLRKRIDEMLIHN
jgi:hypothetical protein